FLIIIFFAIIFINTHKISINKLGNVKVINREEKIFFVFEDFFHPELIKLRKREKLDNVVTNCKTEFEKILALRNWAHSQWKQSEPFPYPPFNANVILDRIRTKKTGGWCGQYGVVFAQACMSFGIPARYLEIMPEGAGGHFVVEVYNKDYNKWILMDPTVNLYYENNNIPDSAFELHKNMYCKINNVYSISGSSKNVSNLDSFYSFAMMLRNNHLTIPLKIVNEYRQEKNTTYIRLIDRRIWYYDKHISNLKKKEISPKVQFVSSDINDFYWEPDIVVIKILEKNWIKKTITLEFSGLLKNYQNFFVSSDGQKTWHETDSKYEWKLKKGSNMLEVTAPDITGLKERFSYIIAELGR
ncbi:MAG: transglutaminase-like domain-containing protein, partial [Elusimicrobiota bacterium]|nr:transglutaminase-like domain-containing protein [Elusimicrobiota bacterium]